jgi:hypothetical protein
MYMILDLFQPVLCLFSDPIDVYFCSSLVKYFDIPKLFFRHLTSANNKVFQGFHCNEGFSLGI